MAATLISCGTGTPPSESDWYVGSRERVKPSTHGQLQIVDKKLCDQDGNPVWLRGMSSHGLQWYPEDINADSLAVLADEWHADVVRLSMYVTEDGYNDNPAGFKELLDKKIDLLKAKDMYIIIDWHMLDPGNPDDPVYNDATAGTDAASFWEYAAEKYGNQPNFLFEICNEPNGDDTTWSVIKTYADRIVGKIRAKTVGGTSVSNVVLVGTPAWGSLGMSGDGKYAAIGDNPVSDSTGNTMYTFHFYAASHDFSYYSQALNGLKDRIPLFVSESGTQEASGDGSNDFVESDKYYDYLDRHKISWINWNFSHDFRSGAVLQSAGYYQNLKTAGRYIRHRISIPAKF